MATNAISDMLRQKEVPKGSVAILQESIQLGCVSQDTSPRKSTWELGIETHRQISQRAPGTK